MAASSQVLSIPDDYTKIRSADRATYRSLPIMTKYEFDQIIGLRTMHLSRGAPPLVDIDENYTVVSNINLREIAQRELVEKRLPYMVKRMMPNGKAEYWSVADLDITPVRHLLR
jgi:DNA-directed RNA polymerase I, II, and III subunit RPABC2